MIKKASHGAAKGAKEEIASAPLSTSASSGKALLAMTMTTTMTIKKK